MVELTAAQREHFQTFGFLRLRSQFDAGEMAAVTGVVEAAWAREREQGVPPSSQNLMDEPDTDSAPYEGEYNSWYAQFVEEQPRLHELAADERVLGTAEALLGGPPVWVGSEGNWNALQGFHWHTGARPAPYPPHPTQTEAQPQPLRVLGHADRRAFRPSERHLIDFPQMKMFLYLTPTTASNGALLVVPGVSSATLRHPTGDLHLLTAGCMVGRATSFRCTASSAPSPTGGPPAPTPRPHRSACAPSLTCPPSPSSRSRAIWSDPLRSISWMIAGRSEPCQLSDSCLF